MESSRGQQGAQNQGQAQAQQGQAGRQQGQTGGQQGQTGGQPGQAGAQQGESSYGDGGEAGSQQSAQGQSSTNGNDGFDNTQGSAGASGEIDFSEASGAGRGSAGQSGSQGDGMDQGSGSSLPSAASYEERVAILDRQLEGSMSEYDGMILRERRNILERGGQSGSEQQVETFDRNVAYYEEGDLDESGSEEGSQGPNGAGGNGGLGDDQSPQVAQAGGHPYGSDAGGPGRANDRAYAPPGDIPSGDDDDVVARQIREAAMYEDDPELREKLWEEYRKYKEQTR